MMMTSGVQIENHTHHLSSASAGAVAIYVPKNEHFFWRENTNRLTKNIALNAAFDRSEGDTHTVSSSLSTPVSV